MHKIGLLPSEFNGLILGVLVVLGFGEKMKIIQPVDTIFLRHISMIIVPLLGIVLILGVNQFLNICGKTTKIQGDLAFSVVLKRSKEKK